MPVVWARRPEAVLDVVGRWPGAEPRVDDRRVRLHGFVPQMAPLYRAARCCVAPVLGGGGTPLKVVVALAYGLPLVATPQALRGLPEVAGSGLVRCAPTATRFAEEVLALLDASYEHGDRARRSRELVERHYSVTALSGTLAESLS